MLRTLRSTAGTYPAEEVILKPLAHPITSFTIPNVFVECVFSETGILVVFGVLEEIEVLWSDETENAAKKSVKDKCMILYKNSNTVVTQHKLMKLLAIEELLTLSLEALAPEEESVRILNEWRIHWCRD
ncbi:hypothetical protein P692DRAFT_201808280 [Suillus brevipes Sb2]|nr:hypothetical protein P692DRAFT_201808280 [Suillus brevipes Sb2]